MRRWAQSPLKFAHFANQHGKWRNKRDTKTLARHGNSRIIAQIVSSTRTCKHWWYQHHCSLPSFSRSPREPHPQPCSHHASWSLVTPDDLQLRKKKQKKLFVVISRVKSVCNAIKCNVREEGMPVKRWTCIPGNSCMAKIGACLQRKECYL